MLDKVLSLSPEGRTNRLDARLRENFSYDLINQDDKITIGLDQQMLLTGPLVINGCLELLGKVFFLDLEDKDTPAPPIPDHFNNFSFKTIDQDSTVEISQGQQMLVSGALSVLGTLNVFGEAAIFQIEEQQQETNPILLEDNHSYFNILSGETKKVLANQQMPVFGPLTVSGVLNLLGSLVLADAANDEQDYLPPFIIEEKEKFEIVKNKILSMPMFFRNFGTLKINGILYLGA